MNRDARAQDREPDHTLTYSQEDLVSLLQKAIEQKPVPDLTLLAEGRESSDWAAAQLEGFYLLDTLAEEDGCVYYIAFSTEERQLAVLSVNLSAERQVTKLLVEQRHEMNASVRSYTPAIPAAAESGTEELPESEEETASGEAEPEEEASPGENEGETATADSPARDEDSILLEEPAESALSPETFGDALLPNRIWGAGQLLRAGAGTPASAASPLEETVADITDGVYLTLEPGGYGVITVNTGLLHGGPLTTAESPRTRDMGPPLDSSTARYLLEAHDPSDALSNALRIYSKHTGPASGLTYDYAVHGGENFSITHFVDPTTVLKITRPASLTGSAEYVIMLENTQPVTIKRIDTSELTGEGDKLTIVGLGSGGDDGDRVLNITNNDTGTPCIRTSCRIEVLSPNKAVKVRAFVTSPSYIAFYGEKDHNPELFLGENSYMEVNAPGENGFFAFKKMELESAELKINAEIPVYWEADELSETVLELTNSSKLTATGTNNPADALKLRPAIRVKSLLAGDGSEMTVQAPLALKVEELVRVADGGQLTATSTGTTTTNYALKAKNLVVEEAGIVKATLSGTAGNTLDITDEIYAAGNSLIQAEGGEKGINTKKLYATGGSASFATSESIADTEKTRVVGAGNNMGIVVGESEGLYIGAGSLVMGEGASLYGISAKTFAEGNVAANPATGRPMLISAISAKRHGTLIGIGMNGLYGTGVYMGLTSDNKPLKLQHGVRVIAVGGHQGMWYYSKQSNESMTIDTGAELIAVGGGRSGIYLYSNSGGISNLIVDSGGKVYARGANQGLLNDGGTITARWKDATTSSHHSEYPDTVVIGIGGVADANMAQENTALLSPLTLPETAFAFADLPEPVPDANGLVPYSSGADGIFTVRTSGTEAVVSENQGTTVKGYGGEHGFKCSKDIQVRNGGHLEGYGGNYGIYTAAKLDMTGKHPSSSLDDTAGNPLARGYGKKYGVWAGTTIGMTNNGSGDYYSRGYLYGYGEDGGVHAEGTVEISKGDSLVAETVHNSSGAAFQATSVTIDGDTSGTPRGLLHEIYGTSNFTITSGAATPVAAMTTMLGTQADTPCKLYWTTPENGPALSENGDGRHWINYDPADDQKLVNADRSSSTASEKGLYAFGNAASATVVGSTTTKTAGETVSNAGDAKIRPDSNSKGNYRITLKNVAVKNYRTMNLELSLKELLQSNTYSITPLPSRMKFKLESEVDAPFNTYDANRQLDIDSSSTPKLDPATGTISLVKLRQGTYTLTAVNNYGYPFQDMPVIRFTVSMNTEWSPTNYDQDYNYNNLWYPEVKILEADPQNPTITGIHAKVDISSADASDGTGTPSFNIPASEYDETARRYGTMELYYHRIKYTGGLDFQITDPDTGAVLPGSVEVLARRGGAAVTGLTAQTVASRLESDAVVWDPIEIYAGLDYRFEQKTAGITGYQPVTDYYEIRLGENNTFTALTENSAYSTTPSATSPHYVVRLSNDMPLISIPLQLHDKKNIAAGDYTKNLKGGGFKLTVTKANGSTEDITSSALEYNSGTGEYTLKIKGKYPSFTLEQTSASKKYEQRAASSQFKLTMLSTTDYQIDYISSSGSDHGWENRPLGSGEKKQRVDISNLYMLGSLEVRVATTGLWKGHDDAVYLVKAVGVSGNADGKIYNGIVKAQGGTDYNTYKTQTTTGSVTFPMVYTGTYTLTITPALRTTGVVAPKSVGVDPHANALENYSFTVNNEKYLSGGAASRSDYVIDFS